MIDTTQKEDLFIAIGNALPKKLTVYAIGGTAMMLQGIKNTTLDIDLVFDIKKDREQFMESLRSLGAKESDVTLVYGLKTNTPFMLELENCRFDLFTHKIISSTFSPTMKERAKVTHEFNNLVIKVADPNDIFILKSVTSRLKDEEDIVQLIKTQEIHWEIIIEEATTQVKLGKKSAILQLGTLLEKLRDKHKIKIPKEVLGKLWKILKKQTSER